MNTLIINFLSGLTKRGCECCAVVQLLSLVQFRSPEWKCYSKTLEVFVVSVELRGDAHSKSPIAREHTSHCHHDAVLLQQPLAQLHILLLNKIR